jgi:crossover junction endodeoxyribonuclease RuvC
LSRIFIGIDPGLHGGIAVIDTALNVIGLMDTPILKAEGKTLYSTVEMTCTLRHFCLDEGVIVILEQAQAMPGQGVSSTFSTGYGFGLWSGIIAALELPHRAVRPSLWTRKVLAGSPGEGKAKSIGFVTRMFPGAELVPPGCRKPRDGRADALCLAYFGATMQ